jgi:hypothetical protein
MGREIKLSTNLLRIDGYFCTYWGVGNSERTLNEDCIQDDFEQGLTSVHQDYYWRYFDNSFYMSDWDKAIQDFLQDELKYIFMETLKMKIDYVCCGHWSPREYNFSHDTNNFNISAKSFVPLLKYCLTRGDAFSSFLKKNYSSCDGFMSNTSNNISDWKEDIKNNDETAWGAAVSFMLYDSDSILTYDNLNNSYPEVFKDMHYTKYIDYEALENFETGLANGTLDLTNLTEAWKKALFERDVVNSEAIVSQVGEMYNKNMSVEDINKILQDNFGEYDFEKTIKKIFTEIGNYSHKLF